MDKVADKIAAMGIPGLILLVAMATTGLAGAAAITAALALLGGPFGMLGGIAVLGMLGLISKALAQYGFDKVFEKTVEKLQDQGMSRREILTKIEKYPISSDLKIRLRSLLQR